jgi:uncharacterized Zn finger protein (UPF0148 family)
MGIWDEIINSNNQKNTGQNNEEGVSSCSELGAICPQCGGAHLEYDGKLNLVCPVCSYEATAGFT